MTIPTTPTRESPAMGSRAAVSAGHRLATSTALDILQAGGNAVDAAVAGSAVQTVVEFPWCGLGGDLFMMIHREGEPPVAINGSGIAPREVRAVVQGPRVPRFGPASVSVPGLPGVWGAAASRFGTRPLTELLHTAVMFAREGFTLDERHEASLTGVQTSLGDAHELRALLDNNGSRSGEIFVQTELAESLARIGEEGADVLYRGELGAAICDHLRDLGGALSREDLASFQPDWVTPLSLPYRGYTVLQHPPVSMGITMLVELGLLGGMDVEALADDPVALIDLMVRCKHVAFDTTQGLIGDPDIVPLDHERLLSSARLQDLAHELAGAVDGHRLDVRIAGSDTTCLAAMDDQGWTVTCIQSLFNEFGSRVLVPGTGIMMNDRLGNLTVDGGPSGLQPGRRPIHTLNAYQVFDGDRCIIAGATPGGRGQVQTNFQILVNTMDLGMAPQEAVDAPRWLSGTPRTPDDDRVLHLEHQHPPEVATRLRERGHDVSVSEPRDDDLFGCSTVVARGEDGGMVATSDERRGSVGAAI